MVSECTLNMGTYEVNKIWSSPFTSTDETKIIAYDAFSGTTNENCTIKSYGHYETTTTGVLK
jgi:hypothetical protein